MKLLELFSGTGSVGKAFIELGWEVFSVDLDPKCNPNLVADVKNLTPEQIPFIPDFIWASPPCTHYSIARSKATTPRDLEGSDQLVERTLALIDYYSAPFMLENPFTGLLKSRWVVQGIPMRVLDYCQYGAPYRKRTAIWTNTDWVPSKSLCRQNCASMEGTRHRASAQQGPSGGRPGCTLDHLHALPVELCREIARFATALQRVQMTRNKTVST